MIVNLLRTIESYDEVVFNCIVAGVLLIIVVIFGLSAVFLNLCKKREERRVQEELDRLYWCCDCKHKNKQANEWPCSDCAKGENHWEYDGEVDITEED